MKKGIFPVFLILVTLVLTGVSCKSTPKPEDKVAEIKSSASLKVSEVKLEEARKRASDFESPAYFPSEWEDLEARYEEAGNMERSTDEEIQEAAAFYNELADSYDELFMKTVPLYAQAREDEILSARGEVVSTGFPKAFPQYLKDADNITLEAQSQFEAEEYYKARDTAASALSEYESLQSCALVYLTRQEIIDRDFISYDPENFSKADEISRNAMASYDDGDKKAAYAAVEEARLRYNVVLQNGWTSYASVRRATASSEREAAIADKANVAARDLFKEADALYSAAEENFKLENFSEAGVLFIDAEALYVIAIQETDEKRQRALETIKLAEEKIEESVETAIEADRIIEGGLQ